MMMMMQFQMHARVHGHLLGDGLPGGGRAGELCVRRALLRTHPAAAARLAASRRRSLLLHRQAVHAAHAVHGLLSVHQCM